jgi:hypothetical protein
MRRDLLAGQQAARFLCDDDDNDDDDEEGGEEAERGISTGGPEASYLCKLRVFMDATRCVTDYSNCTYCVEHNTGLF